MGLIVCLARLLSGESLSGNKRVGILQSSRVDLRLVRTAISCLICTIHSLCPIFITNKFEGCIVEILQRVRILKHILGRRGMTTISSQLSMIFYTRLFVSLNLDATKILPDSKRPAPEVCRSRSLGSKANTPVGDENEVKSDDDKDGETDQDQTISTEGDSTSAKRKTSGVSEYSQVREANIAQNKQLLKQLGLDRVGFKLRGTDKKNEKKATAASSGVVGHMKSDTLSATTSASTSEIMAMASAMTSEITATIGDAYQAEDAEAVINKYTENLFTKEPDVSLNTNPSHSLTTLPVLQSNTPKSNTSNATTISADTPEPPQSLDLTIPASTLSIMRSDTSAPASTITNDSVTMESDIIGASSARSSDPTSIPYPINVDQGKVEDMGMDVDHKGGEETRMRSSGNIEMVVEKGEDEHMLSSASVDTVAGEPEEAHLPSSSNVAMVAEHEKGEEDHTPSSANIAMVAAPAWLTALNMDIYLEESSDAKEWQGLVQSLYKFENRNSINGVRITTSFSFSFSLIAYP